VAQLVEIAQRAEMNFPELAHEFLQRAKNLLDEKAEGQINRNAQDLPKFAFAYARYDPVYSRRVLEQEWEQRLTEVKTSTENSGWLLGDIVTAMAAVDFDRALEMARAIPAETANGKKDENARFEAQRKLAQYLTLFPVQRRTLKFGHWNVSDAWNAADE
jgi:hypothetical protein